MAYIDARDVMERLDEVCGPANWQCKYSHAGQKTVCDIGINISGGKMVYPADSAPIHYLECWVWKADGAGDSDIEAEKGALSDAFKRAAVRWGIGRYLYDLKSPWVPCESRESNGKRQFVKFTDDPWKYVGAQPVETKTRPVAGQTNPATLTPEQRLAKWIEEARAHIEGIRAHEEYDLWRKANEKALAKLASDYPDKYEQLEVFIDGKRDNWTTPF